MIRELTMQRFQKVKELIDGGMSKSAALDKIGMNVTTFQKCAANNGLVPVHRTPVHKKQPEYIDLIAKEDPNIIIVVCKEHQLNNIMRELK